MMIRMVLIAVGAILVLDTVAVATKAPIDTGVIMPAILGLPLVVWGLALPHLDAILGPGLARAIQWVLITGYGLFLVLFGWSACLIIRARQRRAPEKGDVMVVLGCHLDGDTVGRTLALRLDKAREILRRQPALPVIVSGGKGPADRVAEAEAMAGFLLANGIEIERIQLENASANTFENLTFSLPVAQAMTGLQQPCLLVVTSGLHLYRTGLIADGAGIRITGAGSRENRFLMPNMLLRETIAIMKYHVLGY